MLLVVSWFAIDWSDARVGEYPGGVVLRDSAGEVMRVSLGPGDVDCRPYYQADREDWIVKALVAVEDGTFFEHHGVRPLSVVRAAFQNIVCRRRVSGASTITMQAVRLVNPHPKSLWWKYKEAVMALKMERCHDKLWILSQYLNRAPFGSNLVGIESAAQGWFGKSAKELGIGEAAMLAGMVQAPSRYRPDRGFGRASKRREYVLSRMRELGMITAEQEAGAKRVMPEVRREARPFRHPHYCDWYLQAKCGRDGEAQRLSGDFVSPLDEDIQVMVEENVKSAADAGGYSVSAVVMKAKSGDVVAMACSGDYFRDDSGQVNTALAYRPAGSTLKPLLSALAMDLRFVSPETLFDDSPVVFKGYRPANFDSKYRGEVSLRDSLILSLNIPFVKMLNAVGVDRFVNTLNGLGFGSATMSEEGGLGLAIGNGEVTLLELVGAYAKIARGGDGVISPRAAYEVSEMLSGPERSSAALGHVADTVLPRFAWKTGTSSAYRDAWTVMWNPEYVIGVWCGHKSGGFGDKSLVGALAAAPAAWKIARALYPQNDAPWFAEPDAPKFRAIAKFENDRGNSAALSIASPEDGAKIVSVPGMPQQSVVCKVLNNPTDSRLWWFVDGAMRGESSGTDRFALELTPGDHCITCSTADGVSSSVSVTVE